jgi:hypothetical protein
MESVWLGGWSRLWSGAPVWIFLGGRHFAAKAPSQEGWISLDFLGFSRPNLDFSMGYEDFSLNEFSRPLFGGEADCSLRPRLQKPTLSNV